MTTTENWNNWNATDDSPVEQAALLDTQGWKIPLKGVDPNKGLYEVIVTLNYRLGALRTSNSIITTDNSNIRADQAP